MQPKAFIALLRGINVSGHNTIPMAELRALCAGLGWADVQTYLQSGNVVFRAAAAPAALETRLERAITSRFTLTIPVIVRVAADWPAYVKSNPFPEASADEPNLVMVALAKAPPEADAAETLRRRAAGSERVVQAGDALWIHFAGGVARSKLSPSLLDRVVGSPVTMRNWRTVLKLQEMTR
jgi:uncharacterized protein (DUF1697 family)